MPPFSKAISSIVFPKYSVWSKLIEVITLTIGLSTAFVESSLPPIPVSNITKSTDFFLKYKKAAAVIISKKEKKSFVLLKSISALSFTTPIISAKSSSDMYCPFILILSLYLIK